MELESLNCGHCGAPLQVPRTANYVKCNHCGSQLAVRRSASATFTESVDKLTETTEGLAEQVSKLTRQNEMEALDRRWAQQQATFMISDKHGRQHLPTSGAAVFGGVAVTVFGCIWTAMALGITSSAPSHGPFIIAKFAFPAFGVVFVICGIVASVRAHQKAKEYQDAARRYHEDRERMQDG